MPVDLTFWLGRAAAVICLTAIGLLGKLWLFDESAPGRQALERYVSELDARLRYLRWSVRSAHVAIAQGATAMIAAGLALSTHWTCLAAIPVAVWAPSLYCTRRVAQRTTRIEEQIEPWLNALANALKASPSLRDGLGSCLPLLGAPISEEIDVLIKETDLGTPLDQALDNMALRVRSQTLSGAVLALRVARRSGGNLPAMLEQSAAGLREMARLEGVVRTKTAEGKAQAFVVAVIPLPMVAGMHWMDPQFFVPLTTAFTGHLIVTAAAVLWLLAIVSARKILDVDI